MKILITDDDKTMRALLIGLFNKEGYEVHQAESGGKALEIIQKISFDMLVLDYNMPDISGYDLLVRCKTQNIPLPPTVFISAKSSVENVKKCIDAGARDFIVKPFDFQDLIDRVKRQLESAN
jgi:DNA-binding response OmpR family regulator